MNEKNYIPSEPPGLPAQIGNVPPIGINGTMTSLEIAEVVEKRHDNVKRTIESLAEAGLIAQPQIEDVQESGGNGRTYVTQAYRIGKRDSFVVVARLSPEFTAKLVDYWQAHEAPPPAVIPTTAEAFASAFTMIADSQRHQAQQQKAIAAIETKLERVEQAQTVLSSRPANAENITHIRKRIGKLFGLSAVTIEAVMHAVSYSPREAGMVRNEREEALGNTYAVYWRKDVTNCFRQFSGECTQVTATMWTHPQIEGRFKMAPPAAGVH